MYVYKTATYSVYIEEIDVDTFPPFSIVNLFFEHFNCIQFRP